VNAEINGRTQPGMGADLPTLVIIASSAGGVTALSGLLGFLLADLPIAIAIVQHIDPDRQSVLPEILGRHTDMRVKAAEHGDRIEAGVIYIAPPDYHLMVCQESTLELSHRAQVRFSRPSADHLFESAAEHYAGKVIAIVLTGMGQDGSQGIGAVRRAGGTVIVQEPGTARFASMPDAAVGTGNADYIVPLEDIAHTIAAILEPGADT
jgi:two-component system chemotaxis response regulator CheB